MHTDPISDFLTRLRTAQDARHEAVELPSSRMKFTLAKILEREGFVGDVSERTDRKSTRLNSSHIQKSRMPSSA